MIKVQFKLSFENNYSVKEYTYNDYEGVQVGDVVLADTTFGIALAKVTEIDVIDNCSDTKQIKSIITIVMKAQELIDFEAQKELQTQRLNEFVAQTKRKILIDKLVAMAENQSETKGDLEQLSTRQLQNVYDKIFE